jgi:glycosyltransferase involved in cell wall biosynthesis
MRIAVFDYRVTPTNPIGGCHRRMLQRLCGEHDFTVFAVAFDNPCPERIAWVRVPAPSRPLALLFVVYHLLAPLCYLGYRLRHRGRFDLVQIVESNLWFGDVSYTQFCHRAYLRRGAGGGSPSALRGVLRWLDHRLHALVEPWAFRRVASVVVPSDGLAHELEAEYPVTAGKLTVVSNPVDLERMAPPAGFDRAAQRAALGYQDQDVVVVFAALGHFERKGLPILLDALEMVDGMPVRLLVVGGQADLVRSYQRAVRARGLAGRVRFAGMQDDLRPLLWAGDLFTLPSAYETFSLVSYEAAAATLPLLVTPLYGVEDMIEDGGNGFLVERSCEGLTEGLRRFAAMSGEERRAMGERARVAVQRYGIDNFATGWAEHYARLARRTAQQARQR